MSYNPKDFYYRKAKAENFVARSVFKLQEMDQRFKLFRPGFKVLDLGAAPGSWTQYACQKVGPQGKILGIDLEPVRLSFQNATFITGDIREICKDRRFFEKNAPFNIVLSDMAPKTTGIKITDQARSLELCELAFDVATGYLKQEGSFVCKLFHSGDFETFCIALKKRFKRVEILRPKSTRKASTEIYVICLSFQT